MLQQLTEFFLERGVACGQGVEPLLTCIGRQLEGFIEELRQLRPVFLVDIHSVTAILERCEQQ